MFKFLNRKISASIAILIIIALALLAVGVISYQYSLLFKEISNPPIFLSPSSEN